MLGNELHKIRPLQHLLNNATAYRRITHMVQAYLILCHNDGDELKQCFVVATICISISIRVAGHGHCTALALDRVDAGGQSHNSRPIWACGPA